MIRLHLLESFFLKKHYLKLGAVLHNLIEIAPFSHNVPVHPASHLLSQRPVT